MTTTPAVATAAPAAHQPALAISHSTIQQFVDESWDWFWSHWLQVTLSIAIGTALVLAMLGLRLLATRLCEKKEGWASHWPTTIGRVISKTSFWFMVLFAAKLVGGYADPPVMLWRTITVLFTIASALQIALWVREGVLSLVEHRAGGDHSGLASAIGIIRLLVTVVLFAVATVAILDNLGVNVTGIIAGLGIGGIAIGLAAKGIFDDLFSALSIIFDRPFSQGDAISWDKTSGTVEAIGLKTTRVRAITGEEVIISNTHLLGKELHNTSRLDRRRIILKVGIAYYTPVNLCADVPKIIAKVVAAIDKCKLVRCGLIGFGDSSLDYEVQFDVYSDLYDVVFDARHRVSIGILRAFNDAHIDFAWPTQVGIPAAADGRPVSGRLGAPRPPEGAADDASMGAAGSPSSAEKAPD
jgi:small-conductance mechanosensitive channel